MWWCGRALQGVGGEELGCDVWLWGGGLQCMAAWHVELRFGSDHTIDEAWSCLSQLETYGISVQSMNGTDVRMTDVMRVAHQPFTTKKLSFKMNGATWCMVVS